MNIKSVNLKFRNSLIPLDLKNVEYLIIHHTASKEASAEQIHGWHQSKGWSGAGYNELIRKDGSVFILRGDNVGAHCADNIKNYNEVSYGICCEGDFDKEIAMNPLQYNALIERIKYNQSRMKNATLMPHRQLTATSCPGKFFPWKDLVEEFKFISLKFGSTGANVKKAQESLNKLGFNCGIADGMFGVMTKVSVVNFQKENGLLADGVIGKMTWDKLNGKNVEAKICTCQK